MKQIGRSFRSRGMRSRRGSVLLYASVAFFTIAGFMSLAVDMARARLVQVELQTAADAAARAAASSLDDRPAARTLAETAASLNRSGNASVMLVSNTDVQFGNWNPGSSTFTTSASGGNAVRVTAMRTEDRGNAMALSIGRLLGINTFNVSASAIALQTAATTGSGGNNGGGGLIGLDSVKISGSVNINSYESSNGTYQSTQSNESHVASNGDITLSGSAKIMGDARPGINKEVKTTGNAQVTGFTSSLTTPMAYDPPQAGPYNNNAIESHLDGQGNFKLSGSKSYTIPPGTYMVKDFNVSGSAKVTIDGEVTLYVTGDLNISGSAPVLDDLPSNFRIRMLTPGKDVKLSGSSKLAADIFAPLGDVTLSGSQQFYGAIVAKNLTISGSVKLHHDKSLSSESSNGKITLVR